MNKHLRIILMAFAVSALLWVCAGSDEFSARQEKAAERNGKSMVDDRSEINSSKTADNIPQQATGIEKNPPQSAQSAENSDNSSVQEATGISEPRIDLHKVKPDESGKIMIVMFHNFVEAYKSGDKEYTTTFGEFEKLLTLLYESGYRLIGVSDYLNNNISVPAGCIPMIFTFDDGTAGQFNLVDEDGKLKANSRTAVGIMEEFNKTHPDFGLKGTFYVNLGVSTFNGKGTLADRLKYLIEKGFEIGNHTLTHVQLNKVKTAEEVQREVGGNQKKMYELIPGYKMISLSLPYGLPSKELQPYIISGEFEGIKYENLAIMEVGWDPAPSPVSKKFNPFSVHRVRASGIEPVKADLAWWLKNLSRSEQYVSDGNPDTVTVPKEKEQTIDKSRLNGKQLIVY